MMCTVATAVAKLKKTPHGKVQVQDTRSILESGEVGGRYDGVSQAGVTAGEVYKHTTEFVYLGGAHRADWTGRSV